MRALAMALLAAAPLAAQAPMDLTGWLNKGIADYKSGHYPEAAADFQKAVNADPKNVPAHLFLGRALMEQFTPGSETPENTAIADGAAREFQRVVDLDPVNQTAMQYLASLYLNQKHWEQARSWYRMIIGIDPDNKIAWYSMAVIAWSQWYPAYSAARTKVGLNPEDPGPLPAGAVKAELKARRQAMVEEGIADLKRALETDPQYDDAMAYMNLFVREWADVRDTPVEYARDVQEADDWVDKAMAVKRGRAEARSSSQFFLAAAPPPPPPPPPPDGAQNAPVVGGVPGGLASDRIRLSEKEMNANAIRRVPPIYPQAAKKAGISGSVNLRVVVGKDGSVQEVEALSGPEELRNAAADAVKQWLYKPTLSNGEPVEVETTVVIHFSLQ